MLIISYILKLILVYLAFRYSIFGVMLIRKAYYQIPLPPNTSIKTFGTFVLLVILLFVHLMLTAFVITDENTLFFLLNSGLFIFLSTMIFYRKKCKLNQQAKPVEKLIALFTGFFFYVIFMFIAFDVDIKNNIITGLNSIGFAFCVLSEYRKIPSF